MQRNTALATPERTSNQTITEHTPHVPSDPAKFKNPTGQDTSPSKSINDESDFEGFSQSTTLIEITQTTLSQLLEEPLDSSKKPETDKNTSSKSPLDPADISLPTDDEDKMQE